MYRDELYELCVKYCGSPQFTTRMYNVFRRYGVNTIDDLVKTPIDRFKGIYGVGVSTLEVIREMKEELTNGK